MTAVEMMPPMMPPTMPPTMAIPTVTKTARRKAAKRVTGYHRPHSRRQTPALPSAWPTTMFLALVAIRRGLPDASAPSVFDHLAPRYSERVKRLDTAPPVLKLPAKLNDERHEVDHVLPMVWVPWGDLPVRPRQGAAYQVVYEAGLGPPRSVRLGALARRP